jgi:hypothetical protein
VPTLATRAAPPALRSPMPSGGSIDKSVTARQATGSIGEEGHRREPPHVDEPPVRDLEVAHAGRAPVEGNEGLDLRA